MPLDSYEYWVDANMPPKVTIWLQFHFKVKARHVFNLELLNGSDISIFDSAGGNVIILTKDKDFAEIVKRKKGPAKVIRIIAGNLTNQELLKLLKTCFENAVTQLEYPQTYLTEIP